MRAPLRLCRRQEFAEATCLGIFIPDTAERIQVPTYPGSVQYEAGGLRYFMYLGQLVPYEVKVEAFTHSHSHPHALQPDTNSKSISSLTHLCLSHTHLAVHSSCTTLVSLLPPSPYIYLPPLPHRPIPSNPFGPSTPSRLAQSSNIYTNPTHIHLQPFPAAGAKPRRRPLPCISLQMDIVAWRQPTTAAPRSVRPGGQSSSPMTNGMHV